MKISGFCTVLFFLSVRCCAWHVNIGLLYGVIFLIGSVRCPHRTYRPIEKTARTEPIGKTAPYRSPIFTCHAPHRTDRKNNTVRKPDIYMPYVSMIYCCFPTK